MSSYLLSKKIHRLLVLLMVVSTLVMAVTGVFLKYGSLRDTFGVDGLWVRTLHNIASPFCASILVLMTVSGVVMYFYPMWVQRKQQKR